MSSAGPELPPHILAKRKRKAEEPPAAEEAVQSRSPAQSHSSDIDKRRRVAGPAPPPAPLDERPSEPANASDFDSSDDDFGPAPPTATDVAAAESRCDAEKNWDRAVANKEAEESARKLQRDEWMMLPPQQDDLAARMDPTKIRARKFNTGKGAKGPSGGASSNSLWTETPEQKAKRLQNEVLGISEPASAGVGRRDEGARRNDKEREDAMRRKVKDHDEKHRGKSLYEQHQGTNKAEEDDPSKRAFDREKDMAIGGKIGSSQKKEMLSRASGFGSRFAGGGYL